MNILNKCDIHIGNYVKVLSRNETGIVTDISDTEYYVEVPSYTEGHICVPKYDIELENIF